MVTIIDGKTKIIYDHNCLNDKKWLEGRRTKKPKHEAKSCQDCGCWLSDKEIDEGEKFCGSCKMENECDN